MRRGIIAETGVAKRLGSIYASDFGQDARFAEQRLASKKPRVLILTDNDLLTLGIPIDGIDSIQNAGFDVTIFSNITADPPEACVNEAVNLAKSIQADAVCGFGGGKRPTKHEKSIQATQKT